MDIAGFNIYNRPLVVISFTIVLLILCLNEFYTKNIFLETRQMFKAYYTEIDKQWNNEELERKLLLLPVQMKQRILSYKDWKEQQLRICGKLLLVKLLADFNKPFSLADLQYNEWNKPYFTASFDFNIAHSGDMVVCAGMDGGKIGIDIEQAKPVDVNEMQEYFTENEWQALISNTDKSAAFYKFWVRKEALLKAAGRGVDVPFSFIDVINDTVHFNNSQYYLYDIKIKDGYHACIATNKEVQDISLIHIDINRL